MDTSSDMDDDSREARILHSLVLDMVHGQQPEVRADLQLLLGGFDYNTFVDRLKDGVVGLVTTVDDDGEIGLDVTVPTDMGRQAMGAVKVSWLGPRITAAAHADLAMQARELEQQIGVSSDDR